MHESTRPTETTDQPERFIKLLMQNEHRIYAFILHLVPNLSDADDLVQDVVILMWRKFETYQPGTDFVAWGMRIAHFCILNFRKHQVRSKLQFNSQLLALIEQESGSTVAQIDARLEALRHCVEELDQRARELIHSHYDLGMSVKCLAKKLGMSTHKIYRLLSNIHQRLLQCIRYTLSQEHPL